MKITMEHSLRTPPDMRTPLLFYKTSRFTKTRHSNEQNSPFSPFSFERGLDEIKVLVKPLPEREVSTSQLVL